MSQAHMMGSSLLLLCIVLSLQSLSLAAPTPTLRGALEERAAATGKPISIKRAVDNSLLMCSGGPSYSERCQCASGVYMQWQLEV